MIDVPLFTVSQICARFPGARGAHHLNPSTVTRWILRGCVGRSGSRFKLIATRVGSRWLVSEADLHAFFEALALSHDTTPADWVRQPTPRQRKLLCEKAELELKRNGA